MGLRFALRRISVVPATVGIVLGVVVFSGGIGAMLPTTADSASVHSGDEPLASCSPSVGNPCNVTVGFSSGVACAPPPAVTGQAPSRSLVLSAPGSYPINATEFCGTSVFSSYTSTGAVMATGYTFGFSSGWLEVNGNGTVTANYLTEPAGMFPVMFVWVAGWDPQLPVNWTAAVGGYRVSSNQSAAVIAVPNGTYNVSVTGHFCGPEGLPPTVDVNGTGLRLMFQSYCVTPTLPVRSTLSITEEFAPYAPLLVLFVVFAGVSLAIAVMVAEPRRRV